MLCPSCRRQLERGASYCGSCGTALNGAESAFELVLDDATRVPLESDMTLGRAPESTLVLSDPTVSRMHARITGGGVLEDAGSSHGTWLDGVRVTGPSRLHDGAKIRLGDLELRVERRREFAEAGRTVVVRQFGAPEPEPQAVHTATSFGMKPKVKPGYALKRLDASEGPRRWVLKDLDKGTFLRLSDNDAWLFEQLDGTRGLVDLIGLCEQRFGPAGRARVARLLTDLGERGFLIGVEGRTAYAGPGPTRLQRLFKPREKVFPWVGTVVERIYKLGGWVFFTRTAAYLIASLATLGLIAFVSLIVRRYGTPFVVANKIGWGGVVFIFGRFLVVGVHELAHGLTMASFGRRVERAGLKLVAIFPYAFVDTSEAWFEPRRRRIAISAAGPVSDFSVGAIFALCSLSMKGTTVGDIFFNLAFAAYVGGFFNLNPFIERDGYHILVDWLGEPGLRRRAKEQLNRRLSGRGEETDSPVLARYSLWGLGWMIIAACFAIAFSFRYEKLLVAATHSQLVVDVVMATLWVGFFLPVVFVLGKPLLDRVRGR